MLTASSNPTRSLSSPHAERLTIEGARGAALAARFDRPVGPIRGIAVFAHCFTCSKDSLAARRVSAELAKLGVAVVRFDFTGLGGSDGEFASTDFSSNVEDILSVVTFVEDRYGPVDLLIGHSLGGAAVLCAASRIEGLSGVVTIGAPADAEHVIGNFHADVDRIETDGEAEVSLAGRPFRIRREFIEDVREAKVEEYLAKLRAPLLVMHSPIDATVGIENASRIFTAARHPKSFVSLDKADHLLTKERDARYAAGVIAGWFAPRLAPEKENEPNEESVEVAETGGGKFQNALRMGRHHLFADEPRTVGGLDSGPSPYDLLSGALAACTSMTLRMYADHKGIALGRISVRVNHDRVHAKDCEDCTVATRSAGGKIDRFTRTITVAGSSDDAMEAKLIEIANKCPVHRTLERGASVVTRVED